MPKITFIEHDGKEHHVAAEVGRTLMQVAVDNRVPGIVADCGGNLSCATCHVYLDASQNAPVPARTKQEIEMIECALHTRADSRLSCQIPVTPELDGLVVRLPESQV
jgi:2Fe-2S ferredoxin